MNYLQLHVERHGCGKSVYIPFVGRAPLGLKEKPVSLPVGKAHYLILYARAVTRAGSLYVAAVHGRAVQVGPDDFGGLFVRISLIAGQLAAPETLKTAEARQMFHVEHFPMLKFFGLFG